jgi:hypothetical protein
VPSRLSPEEEVRVHGVDEGLPSLSPRRYPVVWRLGDGQLTAGALRLEPTGFDELASVEVGRDRLDLVNGAKSLVLTRHGGQRVLIGAVLGDVGVVSELAEVLATLQAARTADTRVVVVLPIRRGAADKARRLVDEGPPFDLDRLTLERHHVFVTEREVIFFFGGVSAAAVVEALARTPRVLRTALRWREVVAGSPRVAEEGFAWTRPH